VFPKSSSNEGLVAWCDSDWAGDNETRRSTGGYVIRYNGALIAWRTKLTKPISLSACEAEYYAFTEAVRELRCIRRVLQDLGEGDCIPQIYIDNKASMDFTKGLGARSEGMKHVEVRYLFGRDVVNSGEMHLGRVASTDNHADIMTKPLARIFFEKHRGALMNVV
jgi:hypothetical protein